MGNKESVTITHQKADHDGIQMKKDEANGHALSGLDLTDAVTCETSMPKKSEPPTVTVTKNIKPTPASVQANGIPKKAAVTVEAAGNHVSDITVSAESDTPTKDTTKQPEISSVFNKMFKKKAELVSPASEANVPDDQPINPASVEANGTQSADGHVSAITVSAEPSTPTKDSPKQPEISSMFNKMFKKKAESVSPPSEANMAAEESISSAENPASVSVEVNGTQSKAAVSVEAAGNQISATTVSTDSNKTAKDTPKQPEISSMFNKMFKKKTEPISPALEANVATEELIASAIEPQSQKCNPASASTDVNNTRAKTALSMEAASIRVSAEIPSEDNPPAKDSPKQPEMSSMFNKMFKKKPEPVSPASEANVVADEPISSAAGTKSQKSEPTAIKANTQAEKAASPSTTAVTPDVSTRPEQNSSEEKPVMNFFKTFVSSTKTTKEATASPDVSKEQSKKETPQAPTANEASKIPPPPPPAPPKMETKAEQAVKKDEAPPVQAAASAAKEPETSSKTKTKKDSFNKLFRPKSVVKEEAKPVETQVDASKTSTLEAGAKAEPPPAPKAEDKKATKKSSSFANLLKPKSTEPKKEAPTVATAPAEASASTKAKDEPKPASPAAPAAASPDNKSLGSTDNSSPSTSRKLEKRNSIQLFFKNLGQKRHSDAGVQTEASAPEKAK